MRIDEILLGPMNRGCFPSVAAQHSKDRRFPIMQQQRSRPEHLFIQIGWLLAISASYGNGWQRSAASLNNPRPTAADPMNAIALTGGCFVIESPCPPNTFVSRCAGCAFSIRRFLGARAEAASRPATAEAKGNFSPRTQQTGPTGRNIKRRSGHAAELTISLIDASIYPRALFQYFGKRLSSPTCGHFSLQPWRW
jgi:hypothetical protein